ncbi:MAG: HAD-IA family hydrolase [Clostridia bacterium]|nr:HAD-IA family hydrolase [Clostridia bacterium]
MSKKKYKYLFFDMDGTISNSYPGIAEALDAAFEHYGLDIDRSSYRKYIGPPLSDTFRDLLGEDRAYDAVAWFREYYINNGCILNNPVYDGIPETMKELKERGYILGIASCKKHEEVVMLAKHFGIYDYMTCISGLVYGVREEKAEVLQYAIDSMGVAARDCIMIGDTVYDIEGAAQVGMDCILCSWGFADERAVGDNIVYTAGNPSDLIKFFD